MTTPADLLRAALDKIRDPADWTRGDPEDNTDPDTPRIDCAITAMMATREEFIDRDENREAQISRAWHEAMRTLATAADLPGHQPQRPDEIEIALMHWNDRAAHDDVVSAFRTAIETEQGT